MHTMNLSCISSCISCNILPAIPHWFPADLLSTPSLHRWKHSGRWTHSFVVRYISIPSCVIQTDLLGKPLASSSVSCSQCCSTLCLGNCYPFSYSQPQAWFSFHRCLNLEPFERDSLESKWLIKYLSCKLKNTQTEVRECQQIGEEFPFANCVNLDLHI